MQIFLCHAKKDGEYVKKLAASLESSGFAPWIDYGKNVQTTINELQVIARELQVISDSAESSESDESSNRSTQETIKEGIKFVRNWLSQFLLVLLKLVGSIGTYKGGIGEGVEGYIPFITWARGSLNSQLVNQLFFIDKLSQLDKCAMEIANGY
jgi:hypothetical protein